MVAKHSKVIARKLKKFGFQELAGKHHLYYEYITKNATPSGVKTYLSHGCKDYGEDLLNQVAKQIKLSKKQFLDLLEGNMTRDEYENILRTKGSIK